MSQEINVVSKTQIITVEPSSSAVSIINAGPQGPTGPSSLPNYFVFEAIVTNPQTTVTVIAPGAVFRIPAIMHNKELKAVAAMVTTAPTSGTLTVNVIRDRGGSQTGMLSTKITIDANEKDSSTAAVPAVINTGGDNIQTGDQILVNVDVAGSGAKGLVVELTFGNP